MSPAEIAAGVAADIRKYGHYQGHAVTNGQPWSTVTPLGKCCLMAAPSMRQVGINKFEFIRAINRHLGRDSGESVVKWNDTHTTAEVLAVLDELAAS